MHRAGLIVWEVLNELRMMVEPGISTLELDKVAERRTAEHKARPAFKGYRGYPASLCASINQEVVHGIPSVHAKAARRGHHLLWILVWSWMATLATQP